MARKAQAEICSRIYEHILKNPLRLRLHSRFSHALNYTSSIGYITFVPRTRALGPYSLKLFSLLEFSKEWEDEEIIYLSLEGLFREDQSRILSFGTLVSRDLSLNSYEVPDWGEEAILDYLKEEETDGICGILTGKENVFSGFIKPKVEAFHETMKGDDLEGIFQAAGALAGAGPGLTPSSDDFIAGYLALVEDERKVKAAVEGAGKKTGDFSRAMLTYAGERLYSEDVKRLFESFSENRRSEAREWIQRIGETGHSSGKDLLTGIIYAGRKQ